MKGKLGREFFVKILRSAFITKDAANGLYDMIHDKTLGALNDGYEVNLFDLTTLREHTTPAHTRQALGNRMIDVSERSKIKCKVYPKLKKEWDFLNDN